MAFKAPKPTPGGLWRRVPPAIFPSIMGFLGLGIAWRRAVAAYPVPAGIGEALLGAGVILFAFAAIAYGSKIARRPAVLAEELRILPGRAGVSAELLIEASTIRKRNAFNGKENRLSGETAGRGF